MKDQNIKRCTLLFSQLQQQFAQHADPERAAQKQAYMKSTMPFWGLVKPAIKTIAQPIITAYKPATNEEYRSAVDHLFANATHREEWYAAILYARAHKKYISADNCDLFISIVLKTQWWDIVDETAVHLVGKSLCAHPHLASRLKNWIHHENMWVRRTALLTQLQYKKDTDFQLLAQLITCVHHEKEFFIRKAIGWVLREYSKTNPKAVADFISLHKNTLSQLSIREGSKYI